LANENKVIVTKSKLDALADSISAKTSESLPMTITQMKDAVDRIDTSGGGITPTGTKQISITTNGTTTEDVIAYANTEISVNVVNQDYEDALVALGTQSDLTDSIEALTTYSNDVTGESDTTLSDAVHTLANGYGQGGGDTVWAAIVDRTVTEIDDNDGVCKAIGAYAFYGCKSLTSVISPSVVDVKQSAFKDCHELSNINFPLLISIGSSAFNGCSKLTALVIRRSDAYCTLMNANALYSTPIRSGTGYIYVPSTLIETYKTLNGWKTFAAQFRALEDYTVDGTITGDLDPNKI